ncbi:hypothetical protein LEP3755_36210 [Leptolyngbya sp. NIES-3755]|nr:hypothetical protein LEP3755_36210 [Leptolyngbya sp. NIES-3755]
MQLLDFSQTAAISDSLQSELQDMIHNLQIEPNWCIRHPNYKPLELPPESIERFRNLPKDIQNKYLTLILCNFLYGIYYNGSLKLSLAPSSEATNLALHQNLDNNNYLGVDYAFYDRLHANNQGTGYFSPNWCVLREESDGSIAVSQGGLTLHIQRDRHLENPQQLICVGDAIAIRLPRNLVQNGFYMAIGNAGQHRDESIVRVYFNLTAEGAVCVMKTLTERLNAATLPFAFKALYNPSDYHRYDAAVLYFDQARYSEIQPILRDIYLEHQAHFGEAIPLFTKQLAPGLGLAEEPDCKFAEQESFGMNRCQIVANGLLEAWHRGDASPEGRLDAIVRHFSLLQVDLQHPYLNRDSADIYTPLAL